MTFSEVSSVSTTPGSMHVTRTFERVLNSCLRPSLSAVTACLVAQYTLPDGNTVLPATDEMLIMCPDFFSFMWDMTAAVQYSTPLRLTSTILSHSSIFRL